MEPLGSVHGDDPLLPNELLAMIASKLDDAQDIVMCLVASSRFHGLDRSALCRQKYACATLLSVCASGDIEGLRFVAKHRGVPDGFRRDACLAVAISGGHVHILDPIRNLPSTDKWPLDAVAWSALLVSAASVRGRDSAIASWLCRTENRPTSGPSLERDAFRCLDCLRGGPPYAPLPSAFKISDESALVMRALFYLQTLVPDDGQDKILQWLASETRFCVVSPYRMVINIHRAAMARQRERDKDALCSSKGDSETLEWIRSGRLDDLYKRLGEDGLTDRLCSERTRDLLHASLEGGHADQAFQLYERLVDRDARDCPERVSARSMLTIRLAEMGRLDLVERVGWRPGESDYDIEMNGRPGREQRYWNEVATRAARNGHTHVLQWIPPEKMDKNICAAINEAVQAGHLGAVAWLCAQGYNRSARNNELVSSTMRTVTPLYWAIHGGGFDIARSLLDRTGASEEEINSQVDRAVAYAVEDALMGGDLRAVSWLRKCEPELVDAEVERLRSVVSQTVVHMPTMMAPLSHYDIFVD